MPYNPTATFVASVQVIIDGEQGDADVFNRPIENLDSRTLFLKSQQEGIRTDLDDHIVTFGNLVTAHNNLASSVGELDAADISFDGTPTIPSATSVADAIEQAAQLGNGGGGAAGDVIIRYGSTLIAGTEITHNLGNSDHAATVTISTLGSMTVDQAANVGDLFIVKGANSDMVYMTGAEEGVLFDYLASENPGSGSILSGVGTFSSHAGTVITHNLGNANHRTVIQISDTSLPDVKDVAYVGGIYIVRGENADTVYNSGKNASLKFDYIIS